MSSEDDYTEVSDYEEEQEEDDSLFDTDRDEELSDLKYSIRALFKTLDYDQKEELVYILDNIESIPWDWKKWVK